MKFLLVDDEPLQLKKLIGEVNEAAPGNEVASFNNPLEALNFANENLDIDVAFLDIEMPEINGIELAKKLKEIKPTINIIFVTGYSEYALSAYTLHASGYLTKPVNSQQIVAELNEAASFIRTELASRIELRIIPKLKFVYDESIEYGNKIEEKIK